MMAKHEKAPAPRGAEEQDSRNREKQARDEEREKLEREARWPFGERKAPEPPQ